MNLIHPSTYAAAARSLASLRNLRKVKLFPSVRTVTVIAYYKDREHRVCDYRGKAVTVTFFPPMANTIELAHTTQSPTSIHAPPDETETAEEEIQEADADVEPAPPAPAIGVSLPSY